LNKEKIEKDEKAETKAKRRQKAKDDNKEDEYFSDFEQVEYEIIKYLIKNRLEDGLQRIEGGK